MKTNYCKLLLIFLVTLSLQLNGQNGFERLLDNKKGFESICADFEDYFRAKANGRSLKELAQGEYRDGSYVKYCRWKNFWKDHLTPDGKLGDISQPFRDGQNRGARSASVINPYQDTEWNNISNSEFITNQISLGRTTFVAFHPTDVDIFYVAAAIGGIWKTTDGGQTYTPLGDDLPYLAVSAIVIDQDSPNTIYIAVSDHLWYGPSGIGIYKSTDGGVTWNDTSLAFDFTDNIRIYYMSVDPNDSQKMMVATSDGLYSTTDGFTTNMKINNLNCSQVHWKPNDSNTIYLGTGNGDFYRSTDAGANFNLVTSFGSSFVRMAITESDSSLVYVSNNSNIYRSTDSGASFSSNNALPESNMVISFSPQDNDEIIVGNFEVHNSTNDGVDFNVITDWEGNNDLPLIHVDQRNVFINPLQNDLVYLCNDGGLYTYNVVDDLFNDLSNGLQITQYFDIATSQSNVNVVSGGSQDNGSMYRDSSGIWAELAPTGDGMNTEIDPRDENIIFWEYQLGDMRRFNGSNNTDISPPGENGNGAWETPYRLDPSNPDRLIAGYDKVYESLDQGDNWTEISGDLAGGNLDHIAIAASNGNRIYAVRGSTIYVKDENSNNWTTKSAPSGTIADIEVDPNYMDRVFISYSGYSSGNKVYESIDAGDNWTNMSGSLPNVPVGAFEIYEDFCNAYFVGTDQGVYLWSVLDQDWLEYGNLPNTRVTDIEIQYSGQKIRVGTHGRGIFEADLPVESCLVGASDQDDDGVCDDCDICPFLDNLLIGEPCDDGDPNSSGETYSENCLCEDGQSNIVNCTAEGSPGTGADYITNVSLNEINNTSAQTAYSDFRGINTKLEDDNTYTLSIKLNFAFELDEAYAWIDYDQDGVFESNEEIIMSDFDANFISEGTFTVPNLSDFGVTTMRVRNIYGSTGNNDPCNNYFGEVEDYTIDLVDSCPYDRTVSQEIYDSPELITIKAENDIFLESLIFNPNSNVNFDAGGIIKVNTGVDLKPGANVNFIKGGCTN